jgi:DNA-binding transcriptional ArsR family regulator
MPSIKSSTPVVPISAALKSSTSTRSIPYHPETAQLLGGGARGRTLAIIYRQLAYWSKYAKWKGSRNRKFFYKSQKELAGELGYSEKTISRAIKALRELGLIIVEKLHKQYWKQVFFYYLPHSPYRSTEAPAPVGVAVEPKQAAAVATSTTTGASTGAGGSVDAVSAAAATATSIRTRGGGGFRQNVRIQQREYKPQSNRTLQAIVERCSQIAEDMEADKRRVMLPVS